MRYTDEAAARAAMAANPMSPDDVFKALVIAGYPDRSAAAIASALDGIPGLIDEAVALRTAVDDLVAWGGRACDQEQARGAHTRECPVDRAIRVRRTYGDRS
jgi:hypothetical protein